MPFQSEKQRRYLWANEPEIAREWTDRYGARGGGIMRVPFQEGGLESLPYPNYFKLPPFSEGNPYTNAWTFPTGEEELTTESSVGQGGLPASYRGYPSYEAWLAAQRGGGDGPGQGPRAVAKSTPAISDLSSQNLSVYLGNPALQAKYGNFAAYDKQVQSQMPNQPNKENINPIKKTLATILPGGDPGYVKGGLYNKIFEGLGSAKEYIDIGGKKLKNIGSTIGKPVLGLASIIGKMVDKFDKLPEADQMYISQQMGGAGQMGEGIYRDPQSGALRDKGGLNVRSARGNYAEAVYKEANRYDKAIKRAEEKYGVKWDGTQFVNANTNEVDKNSELATKRNKRNLEMFHYYNNKKIKQKKFVSNYLQSPKVQKQKADEIIAKEKAKKTGHAEAQATGGDYHSGHQSTVGGQTTDWGPMSHMIARGGLAQRAPRGSYFNGGLASLWRR